MNTQHYTLAVESEDRIAVLKDGEPVAYVTYEELFAAIEECDTRRAAKAIRARNAEG